MTSGAARPRSRPGAGGRGNLAAALLPPALLPLALLPLALALAPGGTPAAGGSAPGPGAHAGASEGSPGGGGEQEGCLDCHAGIEDMHPQARLSCTDCHGGDPAARNKLQAHVQSLAADRGDERVAPREEDLGWRRFANPMDLRVAHLTCGGCHEDAVRHVRTSMHATTAGHLSDGYYEMGLARKKGSQYSVFPVYPHDAEAGDVRELVQVPPFKDHLPRNELATHYTDLARKECMQCHLWSEGRAVRGRVGFDGDYRGEGCAACHVPYSLDGLSRSADRSIPKGEPGHPRVHAMTRAPTTQACTACHYGDASIGLHFRGLSQLPPAAPGGPDIPGTTDQPLNRAFYLDDPAIAPPDVHHERGMHCIDCHTQGDVMGDGRLWGAMEHAVEISCSDCHGTFDAPATLRTRRGTPLEHLRRSGGEVVLVSKVDGREHRVPQAVHVLDPARGEFNAEAARAMTGAHAGLECYTCHAAWNVNFPGFHFDRNESLSQLDLLSGRRTPGRVTTQEKVFATWKSFYAGLNESGRVAPYLTGFSTMGTVRDARGEVLIDQAMPVTARGLSGMTMVHHQLHSTRPTARSCVECHRSSATWGLGSANFRLGRRLAFAADRRGIEVVALERAQLSASTPLAKLVLPDVVDLELDCDPLQGRARRLFASEGHRGIHEIDCSDPTAPSRSAFAASIHPRGLALAGDHLYCAGGIGGLEVYDVSEPGRLHLVARLPSFDAHAVHVQWPYAYVADGAGGLFVADVRDPREPRLVGGTRLSDDPDGVDAAVAVSLLFQYSRPMAVQDVPVDSRSDARLLCAVLDERRGVVLIDATEPAHLEVLWPRPSDRTRARPRGEVAWRGLALASHVDLAEPQGGTRTREGDFVYALAERELRGGQRRSTLVVLDVSEPRLPRQVGSIAAGYATEMLAPAAFYNPPFLQTVILAPGEQGLLATDVTVSAEPAQLGALAALGSTWVVAVEEFPLDRMLDESGRPLKDVSHAGSRWLTLEEIGRVLAVPGSDLFTIAPGAARTPIPGHTARLTLARLDRDGSGTLEGDELARAPAGLDADGDGRLFLVELAGLAGLEGPERTRAPAESAPLFLERRADPDGDLARLFDGIDPFAHDGDHSRGLDRGEMDRALFDALDLDRDGALTPAELSRHPGELRALRYGGAAAAELLARVDSNKNGRISPRELRMADADFQALDRDRDGLVSLGERPNPWFERRGFVGARSEWPTRQPVYTVLPPVVTVERVLAVFDADGDGVLTQRETRRRPDLFAELDANGDGRAELDEVQRRVDLVGGLGVDATSDGFLARWDLDGDGEVGPGELPPPAARAVRGRR